MKGDPDETRTLPPRRRAGRRPGRLPGIAATHAGGNRSRCHARAPGGRPPGRAQGAQLGRQGHARRRARTGADLPGPAGTPRRSAESVRTGGPRRRHGSGLRTGANAARGHARPGLAVVPASGEGVPQDPVIAARWLEKSSELGNPHAMFLLYNAYREGRGVPRDLVKGHVLLEEAAHHEYPPAIQELAMTVQADDALRAGHLMKEATEHRHNNWNKF